MRNFDSNQIKNSIKYILTRENKNIRMADLVSEIDLEFGFDDTNDTYNQIKEYFKNNSIAGYKLITINSGGICKS